MSSHDSESVFATLDLLMATILSKSIVYKSFGDPRKVGRGSQYSPGDHVTIFSTETPFWTEYGLINEEELYKLDKRIDLYSSNTKDLGATFMVNPPTAWVMLRHFVNLTEGDYIIQNAANSGVGRSVIELCRVWKIKTINIVRNRDNIEKLKTELWKLGANHVFTEEEFLTEGKKFIRSLPSAPRLALNGVGGRSSLIISSTLESGATCVVYVSCHRRTPKRRSHG
uniref:ADH_zinc_N domain-containing protein n=1 Tax=Heterorhabditis bacteriophora TaxID=37862 RepID=A0A1I7WN17_HETBA